MKRLLLALLMFSAALAGNNTVIVMRPTGGGGGDTCTPASGDLRHETFDPTGYDLTWVETVDGGATLNEDSTAAGPLGAAPSGTCIASQILFSDDGVTAARAARAYTEWTGDTNEWARTYFYLDSEDIGNGEFRNVMAFTGTANATPSTSVAVKIVLYQTAGGVLQLELWFGNTPVTSVLDTTTISLDTWYRLELNANSTADTAEWKVCLANAVTCNSEGTGALTGSSTTFARLHLGNDGQTGQGYQGYFDSTDVCDSAFCGE